jgi:O-acetyl-ADP-ribose deacetylase (regulator of RNase III)
LSRRHHQGDLGCDCQSGNSNLNHAGGVAFAIASAAGSELQAECDEYIKKHGRVTPGECISTTSGRLGCKRVIHAVGEERGSLHVTKNDLEYLEDS